MLLLPYKADVDLGRWPMMTLLVCALCVWVFARQAYSGYEYERVLNDYCERDITRDEQVILRYLTADREQHYCNVLVEVRHAPDTKRALLDIAQAAKPIPFFANRSDSVDYIHAILSDSYARFDRRVPKDLTDELQYDPNHPTVVSMLTAAFSHGDGWHLASNLVFFFAFAASVEVITGYFYYLGFIALSAIGTHVAYTYSVQGIADALPTVGLSGVVMAMMAFLATVMPLLSIRCFFWFVIIVRTFRVPALAIAGLYILQNVYDYTQSDSDATINYIAHISGAALGVAMGLFYRLRHGDYLTNLAPESSERARR